ncbi:MAG: 30S ribosomal protein S4 [Candidatus Diapherotrites archaeon CG09_land_8_20_14_0_10_32_12]|nr:MAG: 30S ribosomal protein S4 [Candidatus Diapherotrites archaeon CG09_land_8_20_14_0_10_32_12]
MGDPRKFSKKYSVPKKRFDKERIPEERDMLKNYCLVNKKELFMFKTMLRKKRKSARDVLALPSDQLEKEKKILIDSLKKYGLLKDDATLDSVLSLKIEDLLERRLVMLVFRKGLATTLSQARQFIVHGHIAINGKRITSPNALVTVIDDVTVAYYKGKKPKVLEVELRKPRLQAESVKQAVDLSPATEKEKAVLL